MKPAGGSINPQGKTSKEVVCDRFVLDDEDELVSDRQGICENCHYRRWTSAGMECHLGRRTRP